LTHREKPVTNFALPKCNLRRYTLAYARYTEALVRGLPRVIFVHGTGREVYTSAQ
jgi:hypothetical protein